MTKAPPPQKAKKAELTTERSTSGALKSAATSLSRYTGAKTTNAGSA